MAASTTSVAESSPSARTPPHEPLREPLRVQVLTLALVLMLAVLLVVRGDRLVAGVASNWTDLIFWAAIVIAVNLFPVAVENLQLTLESPLLLAVGFLYPPEVAASFALLAAVDVREFKREVGFPRAVFNRSQVAFSVFLASIVFHGVTAGVEPWTTAILAAALAVLVDYLVNAGLVALYCTSKGDDFKRVARRMKIGGLTEFLATYLGHGFLALVLARLFTDVGLWSVATFLVPALIARTLLVRNQQLHSVANELRSREKLLERLSDRSVDERRDERLRIAGDLHDEVLQSLIEVEMFGRLAMQEGGDSVSGDLRKVVEASENSMKSLRQVIHDLKESPLGRGGLLPTLDSLIRGLRLDWRARIEFETPTYVPLSAEGQIVAYQVAREALLNALKHAQAQTIRVALVLGSEEIGLVVEDDGVGFDPESVDPSSHFGLGLVRERVARLGGTLRIDRREQNGTRLTARLPFRAGSP